MDEEEPWTLTSFDGFSDGHSHAILRSERLDRMMHPSGRVRIFVAGSPSASSAGYTLDELTRASIEDYLISQQYVKQTLEERLIAERAKWGKPSLPGSIWDEAKVESVSFERKRVQTPQGLASLKRIFPKIDVERVRRSGDQPETRTQFTIELDVAWDEEHSLLMTFRDGTFSSMDLF